jgi:hypothetical protein
MGCYAIVGSAARVGLQISGSENGGKYRSCVRLVASFGTKTAKAQGWICHSPGGTLNMVEWAAIFQPKL